MSGQFIATFGNCEQVEEAFHGLFFKGRREPRLAMVGRSNVGKSTLINALLGNRLAQTSAEPGKTRLLHFYLWIEARLIFADLPGFGFAKASQDDRNRWAELIKCYMKKDGGLLGALVLLDSRHGPTDKDEEAIRFLVSTQVPISVVFTKADQLKTQSSRALRKREAAVALANLGVSAEHTFWVSAKAKDLGLKQLATHLLQLSGS